MQAILNMPAEADPNPDALMAGEDAVEYAVGARAADAPPLRILMLVEDPGAANFAAGLLPALQRHGAVTVIASGAGEEQLARLDVRSQSIRKPFDAMKLITELKTDLVVVGTSEEPDAHAHTLVAACRKRGVPSIGLVDGPANIARRFQGASDTSLAFAPDWIFVPGLGLRDELKASGFPAKRALAIEHPHFAHLEGERKRLDKIGRKALRKRHFPGAQSSQPVVVFLAERSDGLDPGDFRRSDSYMLRGRGRDDRRTNIVLEEILDALNELHPRPYVVLRLHPKNDREEFAAYAGEIDALSREEPPLEIVYAADLVIGMTTILLTETAMLGRQAISVVPRKCEQAWLLDIPGARVPCFSERPQIRNFLAKSIVVGGRN